MQAVQLKPRLAVLSPRQSTPPKQVMPLPRWAALVPSQEGMQTTQYQAGSTSPQAFNDSSPQAGNISSKVGSASPQQGRDTGNAGAQSPG